MNIADPAYAHTLKPTHSALTPFLVPVVKPISSLYTSFRLRQTSPKSNPAELRGFSEMIGDCCWNQEPGIQIP